MTPGEVSRILKGFEAKRVLVVGDICLDRWCTYDPDEAEPSRETGLPRIAVVSTEVTPGAGGTIANNLAALGTGVVSVLGILGDDGYGYELRQALERRGIEHSLCLTAPEICTFTYTKLLNRLNGEEDKPRVDFINTQPLPAEWEARLVARLREAGPSFDVMIVSDQAETNAGGLVTAAVREAIAGIARQFPEKVIWVDSRLRPELFRNVIVKPNEDEAGKACLRSFGVIDYSRLRSLIDSPLLLVTHGPRGALLVREGSEVWVPTVPVDKPVDICGAGDSFSAGAAVSLSICGDAAQAAMIGNLVASVTIMKKGTGTASQAEVLEAAQRLV
jgi:rfaE bifunctional protein kinase chain/domain